MVSSDGTDESSLSILVGMTMQYLLLTSNYHLAVNLVRCPFWLG